MADAPPPAPGLSGAIKLLEALDEWLAGQNAAVAEVHVAAVMLAIESAHMLRMDRNAFVRAAGNLYDDWTVRRRAGAAQPHPGTCH